MMKIDHYKTRHRASPTDTQSGYTLIELIEFTIAAAIANTLAHRLAANHEGAAHTAIIWGVTIVGTLVFGFGIMIGFAYTIDSIGRMFRGRNAARTGEEKK